VTAYILYLIVYYHYNTNIVSRYL